MKNKINLIKLIFDTYNDLIAKCYDDFFIKQELEQDLDKKKCEVELLESIENSINRWENEPLNIIDNMTPRDFFKSINSIEQINQIFLEGAEYTDTGLPPSLVEKLEDFRPQMDDLLIDIVKSEQFKQNEEVLYSRILAVRLLGQWKSLKSIHILIDLIKMTTPETEILAEEIKNAFVSFHSEIVIPIKDSLSNAMQIGFAEEYLLMAVAEIGETGYRSNEMYSLIKDCFIRMSNKRIGAQCFLIYGDIRAITFLRGYVLKNKEKLNRSIYLEIKGVVEKLGGSFEDIPPIM